MNEIKPRFKLIAKREFDIVKSKYTFKDAENKKLEELINSANALDVLVLTIVPGSSLQILDVKILNEQNESVFTELLEKGVN